MATKHMLAVNAFSLGLGALIAWHFALNGTAFAPSSTPQHSPDAADVNARLALNASQVAISASAKDRGLSEHEWQVIHSYETARHKDVAVISGYQHGNVHVVRRRAVTQSGKIEGMEGCGWNVVESPCYFFLETYSYDKPAITYLGSWSGYKFASGKIVDGELVVVAYVDDESGVVGKEFRLDLSNGTLREMNEPTE